MKHYKYEVYINSEKLKINNLSIDDIRDDFNKWFDYRKEAVDYAKSIKPKLQEICKNYDNTMSIDIQKYYTDEEFDEDFCGVVYILYVNDTEKMNSDEKKASHALSIKRYYEKNKEKIQKQQKEYRTLNKDKLSEFYKEYRSDNREKILENQRRYYLNNCEKIKEQRKKDYSENKDKKLEQRKKYYTNNREKILEQQKKYYFDNREKIKKSRLEYYYKNKKERTE